MRIQIASDTHHEHLAYTPHARHCLVRPCEQSDLLILAGDIHHALYGAQQFANWHCPVVMVVGNHEAYGCDLMHLRQDVATLSTPDQTGKVHVLENRELQLTALPGVRILGATLWTDYAFMGENHRLAAMDHARKGLSDHSHITWQGRPFTPERALELHKESKAWLTSQLDTPFNGKTIVVTHHVPHKKGVAAKYRGDLLNCAFTSHLPELVAKADLWVFGHTHTSFDFKVGKCRVIANPAGYIFNKKTTHTKDFRFENPKWNPELVVTL